MEKVKYSLVIPCYNEEAVLNEFYKTVTPVMDTLGEPYEMIFVNDGSKDNTYNILQELAKNDKRVKIINFSRNFGQQSAILAGFKYSSGEAVIDMDADLQDTPEAVLLMIEKWKEGYMVVHGKRKLRKGETWFKKVTSNMYMAFLKKVTGLEIPRKVGDFKLFDRKVVNEIVALKEHNRFLRGLTAWVGYKQTEVEFERAERAGGETKYSTKKLVRLGMNGLITNSDALLGFSLKTGFVGGILSGLTFLTFIILAICGVGLPLVAWLFPTVAILASMGFVFNGLTNAYVSRIYDEAKNRPIFIVESKTNFEDE